VFVGFGVVAPEYNWDDYKGVDVRGKIVVMLSNDPAVPDPRDPSMLDESVFKGKARTYYSFGMHKGDVAGAKGAKGVIVVHDPGLAGYPYSLLVRSFGRENFILPDDSSPRSRLNFVALMQVDAFKQLLAKERQGRDYEALKKTAISREFRPIPLAIEAELTIENTIRRVDSRNVVAKLEGVEPIRKDECVVYTAHWDHLGRDRTLKGDQIYNGALDNAAGVATLLAIAKGFSRLKTVPRRTIVFMAVTAEEQGLLGTKYYVNHPLYPLERTLANINIDAFNPYGRGSDCMVIGLGHSTLDDVLETAANGQGRFLTPDPMPEQGFFYRSDHFSFAEKGVPAIFPAGATRIAGKPKDYGRRKLEEYLEKDYHKVSDEVKKDWDLDGAVDDARLLLEAGYRVAQAERIPEWKPGTEFRARREEMLARTHGLSAGSQSQANSPKSASQPR
jgi:Zn-dependent M28 family amino/carboxypeptidase